MNDKFLHRTLVQLEGIDKHLNIKDAGIEHNCDACKAGKMHRIPFGSAESSTTSVKGPLDLVHSDVMGPVQTTGFNGERYVLTATDDFSRRLEVFTLRTKAQVLPFLKEWIVQVELAQERKLKSFRSDNGGEYTSKALKEFFAAKGVEHQLTVAYTPQQNGVAERVNRTLLDVARCLLHRAGLPRRFWPFAIKQASYIKNRVHSKVVNDVPEALWRGRTVQLQELQDIKVFGCDAYIANLNH